LNASQLDSLLKEKQKEKLEYEQYILKQEMSLQRNLKKDPQVAKIFQKKLDLAREEIKLIIAQEKELLVRMEIKKDTEKINKNNF